VDPTQCAQKLAAWVKANHMNGVDIDYEDNNAFNSGVAEQWLISVLLCGVRRHRGILNPFNACTAFQRELRNQLPAPYIISHAPQVSSLSRNAAPSGFETN
jgi:hypothetical protein